MLAATAVSVGTSRLRRGGLHRRLPAARVRVLGARLAGAAGTARALPEAARRLGSGDFSSPVPTEGHDEFAALGRGVQQHVEPARAATRGALAGARAAARVDPADRPDVRLEPRPPALLELALKTAVDAVAGAAGGRVSARAESDDPLVEIGSRRRRWTGLETVVYDAERAALQRRRLGEARLATG